MILLEDAVWAHLLSERCQLSFIHPQAEHILLENVDLYIL